MIMMKIIVIDNDNDCNCYSKKDDKVTNDQL